MTLLFFPHVQLIHPTAEREADERSGIGEEIALGCAFPGRSAIRGDVTLEIVRIVPPSEVAAPHGLGDADRRSCRRALVTECHLAAVDVPVTPVGAIVHDRGRVWQGILAVRYRRDPGLQILRGVLPVMAGFADGWQFEVRIHEVTIIERVLFAGYFVKRVPNPRRIAFGRIASSQSGRFTEPVRTMTSRRDGTT